MPPPPNAAESVEAAERTEASAERRVRISISPRAILPVAPVVEGMVGGSAAMTRLAADIMRVARFEYGVLITGATGTGKTVAARAIHDASRRKSGPYVPVNCAALPRDLIEKMLFGHERGAFTGATERQQGFFEAADGGTLFLDEIAELPTDLQPKLLKALDEKTFTRVGGTAPVKSDVRIIAATQRSLEKMAAEGGFREDLYYRLNVLRVRVPALDERREDIPALAAHALEAHARAEGAEGAYSFTDDALRALMERAWPGNVRDLQHAVFEMATHLEEGRVEITGADVERVLGANVLEFGERDGDVRQIPVPPYLVGEAVDHFLDRTTLALYNTLYVQFKSVDRVAEILRAGNRRTLSHRLKRIERRLEAAASSANLLVRRLRLKSKD